MDSQHGDLHSTPRILRQGKECQLSVLVPTDILLWVSCDGGSRHMQRGAEEGQAGVVRDVGGDTHSDLVIRVCRSLLKGHRAVVTL
jgi:hypothetical protein